MGVQFSSLDSSFEFVGLSNNPWNCRLRPLCHTWGHLLAVPVNTILLCLAFGSKDDLMQRQHLRGPSYPKWCVQGLPLKLVGATGAHYWTESQFIFSHTLVEELRFRKVDLNIWGLVSSWDKSQGIRRRLQQITLKSLPIYLFKTMGKWSSFKITSIYYFRFQRCSSGA